MSRRRKLLIGIAVPLAIVLGVAGWLAYSLQHAIDSATNNTGGSLLNALHPQKLKGEDTGSVNLLLAGNSFDDKGHQGAGLTDSIMVAHVDVTKKKLTLISVPRDLLVNYNGSDMKINEVYVQAGQGSAGLDALGTVVEKVTGLHIDQHMLVGYQALKDAVNAVGGITVDITSPDSRGIYDPNTGLQLPNGPQQLTGDQVLQLARARNDPVPGKTAYGLPNGDFDRQANQRKIIAALIAKAKGSAELANPVNLVKIFDTLSANLRTDLTVGQVSRLYQLTKGSTSGITSLSIRGKSGHLLLGDYRSASLGDVLVPTAGTYDYSAIRSYVAGELKG
ncbi:MAG TPA: LCP family protein [Propionibacteriaceae bacterium]|nr:LCP family protein [Propionibacteriaceae bacterium]